jgi:hypothetical protein
MSSKSTLTAQEKHRQSQRIARFTYAGIILTFLSVCGVAVFFTMQMEQNKSGFKAIHVQKPISFFDYTYVDKDKPSKSKADNTKISKEVGKEIQESPQGTH